MSRLTGYWPHLTRFLVSSLHLLSQNFVGVLKKQNSQSKLILSHPTSVSRLFGGQIIFPCNNIDTIMRVLKYSYRRLSQYLSSLTPLFEALQDTTDDTEEVLLEGTDIKLWSKQKVNVQSPYERWHTNLWCCLRPCWYWGGTSVFSWKPKCWLISCRSIVRHLLDRLNLLLDLGLLLCCGLLLLAAVVLSVVLLAEYLVNADILVINQHGDDAPNVAVVSTSLQLMVAGGADNRRANLRHLKSW